DRGVGVLVDRDDGAGVLDACQVLDRAADAHGHVQLGRDDLAGLADLHLVGAVAGVDRGAGGAHGGAQLVGELVHDVEVLGGADTATAGHDPLRGLQVRTVRAARGQADKAGVRRQGRVNAGGFDGGAATLGGFLPRGGAHGGDHGLVGRRLHGDDGIAGV